MSDKVWLKRILIPMWIVQFAVLIVLVGVSALALSLSDGASQHEEFEGDFNPSLRAINAAAAVILSFAAFTILMNAVEIGLAASHKLNPITNLVMQCVKSTIWTVYFVLAVISAAVVGGNGSGLSIFLALLMFLTCIALLVNGSVVLHRYRKAKLYRETTSPGDVNPPVSHNIAHHDPAPLYKDAHVLVDCQIDNNKSVRGMHSSPV